jgi:hypothetical protein
MASSALIFSLSEWFSAMTRSIWRFAIRPLRFFFFFRMASSVLSWSSSCFELPWELAALWSVVSWAQAGGHRLPDVVVRGVRRTISGSNQGQFPAGFIFWGAELLKACALVNGFGIVRLRVRQQQVTADCPQPRLAGNFIAGSDAVERVLNRARASVKSPRS